MKSLLSYDELIVFDCETTGLDPISCNIIELGCCKYKNIGNSFELKEKFNKLIKQKSLLPKKIVNLTGITDKMLMEHGEDEGVIVDEFVNNFLYPQNAHRLFIAYNAQFDIRFVNRMLIRRKIFSFYENDFLDALTIYKDNAPYPHRLANAIEFLHLENRVINSHRASDDSEATFEVLKELSIRNDDLGKYINLFGYNPKYPNFDRVLGIRYKAQYYNSKTKLYNSI